CRLKGFFQLFCIGGQCQQMTNRLPLVNILMNDVNRRFRHCLVYLHLKTILKISIFKEKYARNFIAIQHADHHLKINLFGFSILYCSIIHLSHIELYQKLPNLYNSYKICAACCVEIFSILFTRDFMMKDTISFSGLAISALLLTACASNPTALAVQKENNQYEVTGLGKNQLTSKNNAITAANKACGSRSTPIIVDE